jgi:flagellar protein FlaG
MQVQSTSPLVTQPPQSRGAAVPAGTEFSQATTATAGNTSAPPRPPQGSGEPDTSNTMRLIEEVQQNLDIVHRVGLQFSVHQASGRLQVKVIDKETGELVREIPPDEILNLAVKLDDMMGIIFDKKG